MSPKVGKRYATLQGKIVEITEVLDDVLILMKEIKANGSYGKSEITTTEIFQANYAPNHDLGRIYYGIVR